MVAIFAGAGAGFERGSGSVLGNMGLLGSSSLGRGNENVFLNGATGNLLIGHRDEFLVGRGPDVGISRTYNSLGDLSDENGDNWRYSTDRRIKNFTGTLNSAGSTVTRVSGDGSEILYSWDTVKSAYVATDGDGAYDKLVKSGNDWIWTDGASQISERYAFANGSTTAWRIVEVADTESVGGITNKLIFTYLAASDKLDKVTTANGEYVQYSWSGNNITQVVTYAPGPSATLTRTRYGYDGSNRLVTVTVDLNPTDNSVASGPTYVTTYTYDGASKRVASISQTDGSLVSFTYDGSSRISTIVQTSATGITRTTTLNYYAGYTTVTDPASQVTRLDYDGSSRLTKVTAPPAAAGVPAQVVEFGYNANGDVLTVKDQSLNTSTYSYDAWGNWLTKTDRLNNVVTRTYSATATADNRNQLLTETRAGSDAASANANHTTRYVYDGENHLRYRVSAEGLVTEYRYTDTGELQFEIDYPEHFYDVSALASNVSLSESQLDTWRNAIADRSSTRVKEFVYDARGNMVWAKSWGFATTAGAASSAEGLTQVNYTYNQAGELLSTNANGENATSYAYDGLGRVISTTGSGTTSIQFNDASSTTVVTLANGLVTTSTYNRAGELISVTDSGYPSATYSYDSRGRLRVAKDASGRYTYFYYDEAGRKIAEVGGEGAAVKEYRYDANDRLVATAAYAQASPQSSFRDGSGNIIEYSLAQLRPTAHAADVWEWRIYDKEDRLIEAIKGDGAVLAYEYDNEGRLVRTTGYANKLSAGQVSGFKTTAPTALVLPTADGARDNVARTFYDKDGRLIGLLDGEGYLTRSYFDRAGQKVSEVAFATATNVGYRVSGTLNQLTPAAAGDDRVTRYVYDGRLLRYAVDGLNQVLEYGYNSAGKVVQTIAYAGSITATSDYTFDNIKALVTASGLAANANTRKSWATYDAAGRLAYAIDAENAVTSYVYDSMDRVTKTVGYAVKRTTTSAPDLATMTSWHSGQIGDANNRITRLFYNLRGDLAYTVDAEGYVEARDYDAARRLQQVLRYDVKTSLTDAATSVTVYNAVVSSTYSDRRYEYDSAGRVSAEIDGLGTRTAFSYWGSDLVQTKFIAQYTGDMVRYDYGYDGAGRLIQLQEGYPAGDASSLLYAYDGLGNLTSETDRKGYVTTRAYDRLGQVVSRTDQVDGVATITSYSQYDAFGNVVKSTDARGNMTWNYYDKLDRLTVSRDAENYLTETGYNAFGEVATVTRRYTADVDAPALGIVPTVPTHAKDATTGFLYDRLGRVLRATDAEGYYEEYTLDAFGNRTTVRNKLGHNITSMFDRNGRLLTEVLPMESVNSAGTVVATSVTNKFEYDARGNRTKMYEAFGLAEQRTTTWVYDKADQLTEVWHDAVTVVNASDFVTTASVTPKEYVKYDLRGNVIERKDANGARTLLYYDRLDRKIAEINPVGTLSTFAYDANGNVTSSRVYGTAVSLPVNAGGAAPTPPAGDYRETSFTYDRLDRVKTSSIANLRTGAWNGSSYATSVVTVTTTFDYDASGNLIRTTDGNGGTVYAYFDKNNRKVGQVDQENYLTAWIFNSEGNVESERRAAVKYVGTPPLGGVAPTVGSHADDRITNFTYDRNGRRLTEQRTGVVAWTVNPSNGTLSAAATSSTVTYTYNGLGLVTSKAEATGDATTYVYDKTGRLTEERRASYSDQNGVTVTPTVSYAYNGLSDLSRTRQGGISAAAGDRITTYAYGAGGRLVSITDAAGDAHSYSYDAAGNLLRDAYSRLKADGTSSADSILYTRDLLGRVTAQRIATWSGAWQNGDSQNIQFNAYGEVEQRGLNGMWQEQFAYDGGGRLWRTNSGDGVWRYFVYDANGNQTLRIESEGANLAGMTIDQAITAARGAGANVGDVYVDTVNATISKFDKRGMAVEAREPHRQLTAATTQTLVGSRTYNAFGEVTSETDARGYTTDFTYNTMGRLIEKKSPQVSYTSETGAVSSARPTETYFYDLSGRMVGVRDANKFGTSVNSATRTLLAGSGYGGAEAIVTAEFHPDGGVFRTFYDQFGDARILRDELSQDETRGYDAMGRLTSLTHRGALLTDYYSYDLLGQRIKHWNSQFGAGTIEVTDYDRQGRVSRTVAFGGDTMTYSYAWSSSLATSGMATFGGWVKTTTNAASLSATESTDLFGRTVARTDYGAHSASMTYDLAGRLVGQTGVSAQSLTSSYFNTGRIYQSVDNAGTSMNYITATFGYDAAGNRTYEGYSGTVWKFYYPYSHSSATETLQNATIAYDALGRITSFTDRDAGGNVRITVNTEYDLVGNVRRVQSTYPNLAYPQYGSITSDKWFRYDAMHRMVLADGTLSGGQIVRGWGGVDITYDLAGRRKTATKDAGLTGYAWTWVWYPEYDPANGGMWTFPQEGYNGDYQYLPVGYMGARREEYEYRADGYLTTVKFAETGYYDNGDGTVTSDGVFGASVLRANNIRDSLGRITQYLEYDAAGGVTQDRYNIVYNGRGQVTSESLSQKKIESGATYTYLTHSVNSYSSYGTLSWTTADNYRNGSDSAVADTRTDFTYAWWDDARTSTTTYDFDTGASGANWISSYYYDGLGRVSSVSIADGRPRTVSFASNAGGQILSRVERSAAANNPIDYHYFVDGIQVGEITNNGNNDPNRVDYAQSLIIRNWSNNPVSAPFRWNTTGGVTAGTFGGSGYDPISPVSRGSQGTDSSYTVRDGDTLASIAGALWGDSSLWYMLAEANGITGSESLVGGRVLVVPNKVTNIHNNASTFEVYNPNEALGDLSPTAAKPPKKANKCGGFGTILLVVIAVAVSAITYGALTGPTTGLLGSIGAGAVSGAAGSIVSQAVGVATGIQDKFSWKGVAMAAIGGAVGGGLGKLGGTFGKFLNADKLMSNVVKGALSSAITQGIGVATGLQDKFDWAGVAAAGIGAGAIGVASRTLAANGLGVKPGDVTSATVRNAGYYANQALSGMAGAIANGAVRSLATGTNFGDNVLAALPDVIGTTIGNMIADPVVARIQRPETIEIIVAAQDAQQAPETQTAAGSDGQTITVTAGFRLSDEDKRFWLSHDLVNMRLDLAEYRSDLERDRARLRPERLAERERTLRSKTDDVNRMEDIHRRVINAVIGTSVTLREGGRTPFTYTIRGPGVRYDTTTDAARDGIALSFEVARITGDSWERGALIDRMPGGGYTYGPLVLGSRAARDFRIGTTQINRGTPMMSLTSNRNTVGYFHIHPGVLSSENHTFSDGDTAFYDRELADDRWEAFLGGSDGSFSVMRPRINDRGQVRGHVITELQDDGYFRVTRGQRLPTDMRGEPR